METIEFEILGEPEGKQNMRPARINGHMMLYNTPKNRDYGRRVQEALLASIGAEEAQKDPDSEHGFRVDIFAYFGIPKSTSKKKRSLMLVQMIPVTKKVDADNISKIVLDSVTKCGCVWKDDSQVNEEHIYKLWSERPRVKVKIARQEE